MIVKDPVMDLFCMVY